MSTYIGQSLTEIWDSAPIKILSLFNSKFTETIRESKAFADISELDARALLDKCFFVEKLPYLIIPKEDNFLLAVKPLNNPCDVFPLICSEDEIYISNEHPVKGSSLTEFLENFKSHYNIKLIPFQKTISTTDKLSAILKDLTGSSAIQLAIQKHFWGVEKEDKDMIGQLFKTVLLSMISDPNTAGKTVAFSLFNPTVRHQTQSLLDQYKIKDELNHEVRVTRRTNNSFRLLVIPHHLDPRKTLQNKRIFAGSLKTTFAAHQIFFNPESNHVEYDKKILMVMSEKYHKEKYLSFLLEELNNHEIINEHLEIKGSKSRLLEKPEKLVLIPSQQNIYPLELVQEWCPSNFKQLFDNGYISLDFSGEHKNFLNTQDILSLFENIAETLVHIHGKGLVHLDIKPLNLLIKKEGENYEGKIIDFGLTTLSEYVHAEDSTYPYWDILSRLHHIATPFSDCYGLIISILMFLNPESDPDQLQQFLIEEKDFSKILSKLKESVFSTFYNLAQKMLSEHTELKITLPVLLENRDNLDIYPAVLQAFLESEIEARPTDEGNKIKALLKEFHVRNTLVNLAFKILEVDVQRNTYLQKLSESQELQIVLDDLEKMSSEVTSLKIHETLTALKKTYS